MKTLSLLIFVFLAAAPANAQSDIPHSDEWAIVTGLTQPLLLSGFNLAVNYRTNHWVFEYSHGMGLNYEGQILRPEYRDDMEKLVSPWSTGPGIGYRLVRGRTFGVDIRAEAKVHRYQAELTTDASVDYTNFDLGGGVYAQYHPFGGKLSGFVIEPSIRYWANIASSLDEPFAYTTTDQREASHAPYPLNLFVNISVGYSF